MLTQVALPLGEAVDTSVVWRQTSFMAAVNLCIAAAGKDPKQAYMELDIDKAQWSRIQSGQAHFPHDRLVHLMDAMGNDIPLVWLAFQRGKGLHLLESEQQRQMRAKDDEIAKLRERNEWLAELLQGKRPA